MKKGHLAYYSHRGRRKHPSSIIERVGTHVALPIFLVLLSGFVLTGVFLIPLYSPNLSTLLVALVATLIRLLIAFVLSLVISIPLALLAERNRHIESFLLPVYDVLESIPVLAFFPVIILLFVRSGFLEGAAIFILFFTMIWSILFSAIGGLKVIPKEVKAVGFVFGFSTWDRFTKITLPALFPSLVTGSILALASGWNIVIVAEALHVYAPNAAQAHDLFGIGSMLVNSATKGDNSDLLLAITVLVVVIAGINLLVWQPLLARAERYKFE